MKRAIILILIVVGLMVVFGLTVWPTAYRYDTIDGGPVEVPVATHRISGKRYVFDSEYGWMPLQFQGQDD